MARAPYKLPSVFVGCPYDEKRFKFTAFRAALEKIPFRWYYADTHLSTKHLLGILTSYIKAVDYCVFDISMWNPNVALEIGLAEGLGVEAKERGMVRSGCERCACIQTVAAYLLSACRLTGFGQRRIRVSIDNRTSLVRRA
jgi:hypothetical protein